MHTKFSTLHFCVREVGMGIPLVVQWLGLRAFTVKGLGSIPGWGASNLQCAAKAKENKTERLGKHSLLPWLGDTICHFPLL